MAKRSTRTRGATRGPFTGLDLYLALVAFPEVFIVIALLVGLTLTGGIFFAVTSGWWPIIGTTLVGAIFIGAVVLLLQRQGHSAETRRRRRR